MFDDSFVLRVERLRDDVELLKKELRQRIRTAKGPVTAADLHKKATVLAERWLVDVAPRADVAQALGGSELADRSIQFQRILTYTERATQRRKYDQAFASILADFRSNVIVPLKARRSTGAQATINGALEKATSLRTARVAFVGKSFLTGDALVSSCVERLLAPLGSPLQRVRSREPPRYRRRSKRGLRAAMYLSAYLLGGISSKAKTSGLRARG